MGTKGTANHVYFTDEILGSGSSATVYVGRNKKSGQLCAVKVYSDWNSDQTREFHTMKMLDHENIIKFISIETESISKGNVLVMELSTGGSVLSMLEMPDFAYGFPEEEFVTFLRDTTSALNYLREKKVVHRDIKPGNILRFIRDDLSSQYKITDFGAARELEDSENFYSIYGTEEYLEPMAYEQALLARGGRRGKSFDASIDLWSIGVTLYHVATGQLPFQAFGGRKNKAEMFNITSKKPSGSISGIQLVMDGQVEWSDDLPDTCLLSRGLKKKLKLILARLLESDPRLRWSFDDFFRSSVEVTSAMVVRVLVVHEFLVTRFYVPRSETKRLSNLENFLRHEVSSHSQVLLHFFHPSMMPEEFLESLMFYSDDFSASSDLLFVHPRQYDHSQAWDHPYHTCPRPPAPSHSRPVSMTADLYHARKCLSFISLLERKCESVVQLCSLLQQFFHALWHDLIKEASKLLEFSELAGKVGPGDFPATWIAGIQAQWNGQPPLACLGPGVSVPELMECRHYLRAKLSAVGKTLTAREKNKFTKMKNDLSEIMEKFRRQAIDEKKDISAMTHNEVQIHKFNLKRVDKLTSNADRLYSAISSDLCKFCQASRECYKIYCDKKMSMSFSYDRLKVRKNSLGFGLSEIQKQLDELTPLTIETPSQSLDELKSKILENLDMSSHHRRTLEERVHKYGLKVLQGKKFTEQWKDYAMF